MSNENDGSLLSLSIVPNQLWKDIPTVEISYGNNQNSILRSMAVIRNNLDAQTGPITVFVDHLKFLWDRAIKKPVRQTLTKYLQPQAYSEYVGLTIEWLSEGKISKVMTINSQTISDAIPLPGLSEVSYTWNIDGGSGGRFNFYVPDKVLGESVFFALNEAALKGTNRILQLFLPFITMSGNRKPEWSLYGGIAGPVAAVDMEEFPNRISVQVASPATFLESGALTEKTVFQGTRRDIIKEMAALIKYDVVFFPFPTGGSELDGGDEYDTGGRPIKDSIEDFVNTHVPGHRVRILNYYPVNLIIVQPEFQGTEAPIQSSGSWVSQWVDITAPFRPALTQLGIKVFGAFNVLFPAYLTPDEAEYAAGRMALGDQASDLVRRLANISLGTDYNPDAAGFWFEQVSPALTRYFMEFLKIDSGVDYHSAPILSAPSFKFNPPPPQDIANPAEPTLYSDGNAKKKVKASEAAKELQVKLANNGTYEFIMPDGGVFAAGPNDYVYLQYTPSESGAGRGGISAVFPINYTGENGVAGKMAYEMRVELPPYLSVVPGLPTYIVGIPPFDGLWELYRVDYELNDGTQRLTGYLRTARLPVILGK